MYIYIYTYVHIHISDGDVEAPSLARGPRASAGGGTVSYSIQYE